MARILFDTGIFSIVTESGALGVGWQLGFYVAGTTTQITTYNAEIDGSANSNPVVLGTDARFPEIWIDDGQDIKWVLSDENGVVKDTRDNVPLGQIPTAPDRSLDNFLTAVAPLPIANGGTNATSAANALTNLGALGTGGGTVTGNIGRQGNGPHVYFNDAAITKPVIYITAAGATDPRSGTPGEWWLKY